MDPATASPHAVCRRWPALTAMMAGAVLVGCTPPWPHPPEAAPGLSASPAPSVATPGRLDQDWPGSDNTGVPDGVKLSDYQGPCTIDQDGTLLDAVLVDCERLRIVAEDVRITRSRINGRIDTPDPRDEKYSFSFVIEDSEVHVGDVLGVTGIKQGNFRASRVEVTGGARSIFCEANCLIEDSWVHSQASDPSGEAHFSGVRMSQNLVLRHNTLLCEAVRQPGKGACSAALTGYGDWAPVKNNLIERNLFLPGSASYCAYGGSTKDKPFSEGTRDIRFIGNVFVRGPSGRCGIHGPVGSFDLSRPGNAFEGNLWDDGTEVPVPDYRGG